MNVLALCTGYGGIELGLELAGVRPRVVCYVEREAFASANLVAAIAAGAMADAPIWSDVSTFDGKPWRGAVDLVTAGFPCQPFSQAGKRLREKDPRHLWPAIARIVRDVQPWGVFLENVQLRSYVEPLRDLRAMGFTVSDPFACTAAELGAGHLRRRVFILAHSGGERLWQQQGRRSGAGRQGQAVSGSPAGDADRSRPSEHPGIGSDAPSKLEAAERTDRPALPRRLEAPVVEPCIPRDADGRPSRLDRTRLLGNGVVPQQAALAWLNLTERLTWA